MTEDQERDRGVRCAQGLRVVAAASLFLLATACGGEGSGERPTPTVTASVTATPTLPSPTRTLGDRESPTPSPSEPPETSAPPRPSNSATAPASPTPSRSEEPETESPSESPTETPSATPEAAEEVVETSEESEVPEWVWWLLALLLLAGVASIPLIVRARRRSAWHADLSASEAEVAWFARELIPQVSRAGSPEAAAGAWRVAGEARVAGAEDRLTALEASAPDEASRTRALVLRDTVRAARARMATVVTTSTEQTLVRELDEVAAQLEVALPPAEPSSPA